MWILINNSPFIPIIPANSLIYEMIIIIFGLKLPASHPWTRNPHNHHHTTNPENTWISYKKHTISEFLQWYGRLARTNLHFLPWVLLKSDFRNDNLLPFPQCLDAFSYPPPSQGGVGGGSCSRITTTYQKAKQPAILPQCLLTTTQKRYSS